METKLKKHIESLDPWLFGEGSLKVGSVKGFKAEGYGHANYLVVINGKNYIARFSIAKKSSYRLSQLQAEYSALKAIQSLGIGPKAYYFEKGRKLGDTFIIIDFIEGRTLEKTSLKTLKDTARLVGRLHSLKLKKGQTNGMMRLPIEENINGWRGQGKLDHIRDTGYKYVDREMLAILTDAFAKVKKLKFKHRVECITHGDLSPRNMVRTRNGLKLIDFDAAAIREPEYDLAYYFGRITISEERKKIFLKEYGKYMKYDLAEIKKYDAALGTIRLLSMTWEAIVLAKMPHRRSKTFTKRFSPEGYIKNAKEMFSKCKKYGTIPKGAVFRIHI